MKVKKYIQILLVAVACMQINILFANWQISITAYDSESIGASHTITLGTCQDCNDGWRFGEDEYDYQNPFTEYTNIHFFHLDWVGAIDTSGSGNCNCVSDCPYGDVGGCSIAFSTDIRSEHPPGDLLSWDIKGYTGGGLSLELPINLSWDPTSLENLSDDYQLYLYVGNNKHDMRLSDEIIITQEELYLNGNIPNISVIMGACASTGSTTHYFDSDGDGWGNINQTDEFCEGYAPEGWVENNSDLNDDFFCPSNEEDCEGVLCGSAVLDNCSVCNGENINMDCAGVCFGSSLLATLCEDSDGDDLGNPGTQTELCVNENGNFDILDGYDLPDLNLYLDDDGSVYYNSTESIYGFQFNVEEATILNAFNDDTDSFEFEIVFTDTSIIAFSPTLTPIPSGYGTLIKLNLEGEASVLSSILISYISPDNDEASGIPFSNFEGYVEICSDEFPDCAANEFDCTGQCGGSAEIDECGLCNGSGPVPGYTCNGIPELFDHNSSSMAAYYIFYIATLDDEIIDANDWIGAFNGDICVGARKWGSCSESRCEIAVLGDDGTEPTDGYMTSGVIPTFKLFQAYNNKYYDTVASENISWENNEFNELESLRATSGIDYCLELHIGANLKSFYALPEETSLANMVLPLGNSISGIITEGGSCAPIEGFGWVGGQCILQPEKGYWFIMQESSVLCLEDAIIIDTSINYNLHLGANLLSFPSDGSINVVDGLPDNIEESILGIITEGGSCIPIEGFGWVGSQCTFVGGKGYWIISNNNISFSYDLSNLSRTKVFDLIGLTYPTGYKIKQSMNQAFYFVDKIRIENETINDGWILAYHGYTLVGAREWMGEIIDIPVMGNDDNGYSQGYSKKGAIPSFIHFNEFSGEMTNLYNNNTPEWENNAIYMLGSLEGKNVLPKKTSLSAYPNPFNPSTNISFSVPNEGMIQVSIYNLAGQEIEKLAHEFKIAGTYEYTWDATQYPSGVYFTRLSINQTQKTQKLVLLK